MGGPAGVSIAQVITAVNYLLRNAGATSNEKFPINRPKRRGIPMGDYVSSFEECTSCFINTCSSSGSSVRGGVGEATSTSCLCPTQEEDSIEIPR